MSSFSSAKEMFSRLSGGSTGRRVVMSGHGAFYDGDGMIAVPQGIKIHFYVSHGVALSDSIGQAVEGLIGGTPVTPTETLTGGQQSYNYRLLYPDNLTINSSSSSWRYDLIVVTDKDRAIPLSLLLKDPRVKSPCEIHWCACRSVSSRTNAVWDKSGRRVDTSGAIDSSYVAGRGAVNFKR